MTIIEINKKLYTVPTCWNELTQKQLLGVIKVLYSYSDIDTSRLHLLKILTGMSWWQWCRASIFEKQEFLHLSDFLVSDRSLTKQLIPSHKNYYGPADDFNNITGDEFVFSEDCYFAFVADSNNDQPLNELVAILYRPAKKNYNAAINPDGDVRQPFNQNISSYNAKHTIKRWPRILKLAIFHWYEGCRQKMIADNPDIFSGGSGETAKYGLLSVMRTIAEGGIHGDFEKVQKMYVKMWMMELNEKMGEAKSLEKIKN